MKNKSKQFSLHYRHSWALSEVGYLVLTQLWMQNSDGEMRNNWGDWRKFLQVMQEQVFYLVEVLVRLRRISRTLANDLCNLGESWRDQGECWRELPLPLSPSSYCSCGPLIKHSSPLLVSIFALTFVQPQDFHRLTADSPKTPCFC